MGAYSYANHCKWFTDHFTNHFLSQFLPCHIHWNTLSNTSHHMMKGQLRTSSRLPGLHNQQIEAIEEFTL